MRARAVARDDGEFLRPSDVLVSENAAHADEEIEWAPAKPIGSVLLGDEDGVPDPLVPGEGIHRVRFAGVALGFSGR